MISIDISLMLVGIFSGRSLFYMTLHLFNQYDFLRTFGLDVSRLMRCISKCLYHSFSTDVFWLVSLPLQPNVDFPTVVLDVASDELMLSHPMASLVPLRLTADLHRYFVLMKALLINYACLDTICWIFADQLIYEHCMHTEMCLLFNYTCVAKIC